MTILVLSDDDLYVSLLVIIMVILNHPMIYYRRFRESKMADNWIT